MAKGEQTESAGVVIVALLSNLGIAVAKFVAAAISGSSSMLTEGVHSVIDTLNQLLLLYGQHRAKKPADAVHPFGYARELYFWSFVVAILIFAVGAGVSVWQGWRHIVAPGELESATMNYIVLGVSAALEGSSWLVAMRAFHAKKGDLSYWQAIRRSKDPAGFIVLFEDSAALLGLAVAAVGVWASHWWHDPRLDGAASIAIGLLLALVAGLLARESKGLLIGERADEEVVARVHRQVLAHPDVTSVNHVRTIHVGPQSVFVAISADFRDDLRMGDGERIIEDIERELKAEDPALVSIYIRPEKREDATLVIDPADGDGAKATVVKRSDELP